MKDYRKYPLLLLGTLLALLFCHHAPGQSIEDLEARHGFQDIRLDTNVREYAGLVFRKTRGNESSEEPFHIYEREKGAYETIGDVPIKSLEVTAFLNKIIEIKMLTPKDTDIMKALKSLYGEPQFSVRSNAWEWRSDGVILSVRSVGKKKLEIIYASRQLKKYIREYNEKGIEKISSDF